MEATEWNLLICIMKTANAAARQQYLYSHLCFVALHFFFFFVRIIHSCASVFDHLAFFIKYFAQKYFSTNFFHLFMLTCNDTHASCGIENKKMVEMKIESEIARSKPLTSILFEIMNKTKTQIHTFAFELACKCGFCLFFPAVVHHSITINNYFK